MDPQAMRPRGIAREVANTRDPRQKEMTVPNMAKEKSYEPKRKVRFTLKERHKKASQERGLSEYGSQKRAVLRI